MTTQQIERRRSLDVEVELLKQWKAQQTKQVDDLTSTVKSMADTLASIDKKLTTTGAFAAGVGFCAAAASACVLWVISWAVTKVGIVIK